MSEPGVRRRKRPEGEEPLLLVDRFGSEWESQYMDDHGWYALQQEYHERFGKWYPGLDENSGSVEEHMTRFRAVFKDEDIDAILKKHPKPEPMSFDQIAEMLKKK